MSVTSTTNFSRQISRQFKKSKNYLAKKAMILGKMDGWDELAVAAANVLPAYARPLFLTTTLIGLSFPVSWGAQGMAADFQEMKNDVQKIKNNQVDLSLKLLASSYKYNNIEQEISSDFDKNNANNDRHYKALSKIHSKDYDDTTQKATEIKKAFAELDIHIDVSDDYIEKLLEKNKNKHDKYSVVKKARDFIADYQQANRKDKQALTERIEQFVKTNKGTLEINDTDWNGTKDTKITKALQEIADTVLEPIRDNYIIALFQDYYTELHNKANLKNALDNDTKDNISTLLSDLKIDSYENTMDKKISVNKIHSDIIQYHNNKRAIEIEQTPITGYFGNLAMSGMTLGTALSAVKSGTQLAGQFGVLPNLMPALTAGLEVASSMVFVTSQASMIAYGLGEAYKGIKKNNDFNDDITRLKENINIKEGTEPTVAQQEKLDHITALKTYNTRKNTYYGIGIAASEAGMIAGSLTGSSPLLMASALGTLAFAGLRMVSQSAESHLTGNGHDHDHDGKPIAMLNPWKKPEIVLPKKPSETNHIHTALCNHDNSEKDFELNEGKLTKSYDNNFSSLDSALKELQHIISHDFTHVSVNKANELLLTLLPKEAQNTAPLGMSFGNQVNKSSEDIYINAILDNPTALENAKEILIDRFEDKGGDDHKEDLKTLKSNRLDEGDLRKILTDNLAELDKPQNAKKILKPLLEERIEKLKAKKHDLIYNMIHLQKISQRERVRIINEEMPLGVLD